MQHVAAPLFHSVADNPFPPPTPHSPASRQAALKSLSQMETLPPVQGGKKRRQFFPGDSKQRENLHTAGPSPSSNSVLSSGKMAQVAYSRVRTAGGNRTSSFDATWPPVDAQMSGGRPTSTMDKAMRRTTGSWVSVHSAAQGESATMGSSVEEENQALREELARIKSGTAPTVQRRSMAAIAGGGFRGPSNGPQKQCQCEALRAKLMKAKAELAEAREAQPRQYTSQTLILSDMAEASVQTSPPSTPSASSSRCPVRDAGVQAGLTTPRAASKSLRDSEMQTVEVKGVEAFDAAVQVVSKDLSRSTSIDDDVIDEPEPPPPVEEADTYPFVDRVVVESPQLTTPTTVGRSSIDAVVQTDNEPEAYSAPVKLVDVEVQAVGRQSSSVEAHTTETQTELLTSFSDAAVQISIVQDTADPPDTCECAIQASPYVSLMDTSIQTVASSMASVSTQAVMPRGTDRSCQVEDKEAIRKTAQLDNRILELEAQVASLTSENLATSTKLKTLQEDAEIWRQASLKNSLGQMNITILCPRAECTVNGERIEMDSWNPVKLQQEFEREVLPRFANVFVEDSSADAASKARGKPTAVERTMQEFAEIFRERLAAMLSAPNAAAAAAAASTRSGVR